MSERGLIGGAGLSGTFGTASSTIYCPLFGRTGFGSSNGSTTEAFAQFKLRGAAALKNLHIVVASNNRTTNSACTLRLNGADSALSVTITANTTGVFADQTNSVAGADGDLLCASLTTGSGAGATRVSAITLEVSPAGQAFSRIGNGLASAAAIFASASTTQLYGFGISNAATTGNEARAQARAMESATLSNLQIYVDANARTTTTTFGTRKNGSNGAQSVAVTAGATGLFEDTTNSDSLAAGDLYCFRVTSGAGTETLNWRQLSVKYTSGSPNVSPLVCTPQATTLPVATTQYYPALGYAQSPGATEADQQVAMAFPGTVAKGAVTVSANASTTDTTWVMRKNGVSQAVTINVTALTTGAFTDLAHSFTVARGDLINWMASGGTTGAVTLGSLNALLTADAVVTATAVSIGSPGIGTPAVSQVHGLAATGLGVGALGIGGPAMTQVHGFTASALALGALGIGLGSLTQVHGLAATSLGLGALGLDMPALVQVHGFAAVGLDLGGLEIGAPGFSQTHLLTAGGLTLGGPVIGTPSLTRLRAPMAEITGSSSFVALTGAGRFQAIQGRANRDLKA